MGGLGSISTGGGGIDAGSSAESGDAYSGSTYSWGARRSSYKSGVSGMAIAAGLAAVAILFIVKK